MVTVSENESKILGVKTGRLEISDSLEPLEIQKQILDLNLDLCRIKIPGNKPDLLIQMEKLGFPWFLLNINQEFELQSNGHAQTDNSLTYKEAVSEDDFRVLSNTVKKCFAGEPGTYFTNPLMKDIISRQAEMEAMSEYVVACAKSSNHWTRIVHYQGKVAGFVLYQINTESVRGELFGVAPEFRKLGLGKDIGVHVINTFSGKKIVNQIKLQNIPSIKIHLRLGFEPGNLMLNVHVVSLLSLNTGHKQHFEGIVKDQDALEAVCRKNNAIAYNGKSLKTLKIKIGPLNYLQPLSVDISKLDFSNNGITIHKIYQNNLLSELGYYYA